MNDKLHLLEEKVSKVLQKLESLKTENTALRTENEQLKADITGLQSEFADFKLDQNDRAEQVKTKLQALLGRIEELEKIGL